MRKRIPGNDVRFRFNEISYLFRQMRTTTKPSRDTSFSKIINDSGIREALYRSYSQNFKYARSDKYYVIRAIKKEKKRKRRRIFTIPLRWNTRLKINLRIELITYPLSEETVDE